MTDIELITQPTAVVSIKLVLLNYGYQEEREIQGDLIDIGTTISAESDIRRVASLSMHVHDESQLVTEYFGYWLDKMVRVYYGIQDNTGITKWFLMGSYLFTNSSYTVDLANRVLNLELGDMMTSLSEKRGSKIGYPLQFLTGYSIPPQLEAVVARYSNYKRVDICEFDDVVPYDVEVGVGSYPLQAMNELVSLWPWYEHYYSIDGVYTVRKIPTTMESDVVMTASEMEKIVISETGNVDYSQVKNSTEIWGKEIDANYTALNCNFDDGVYTLQLAFEYEVYEYGAIISFKPDEDCVDGQKMAVNGLSAYPIIVEAGNGDQTQVTAGQIKKDRRYAVKYLDDKFVLQGEASIHAMCMEYNVMPSDEIIAGLKAFYNCNDIEFVIAPESIFACDRIGIVNNVLDGEEYSNIYSTQLALERASYENWKSTRLQDNLEVQTLIAPWLDVNQKVEYKSIASGETHQYIIREIQVTPMAGTMQLKMVRFYPLYPWTDE